MSTTETTADQTIAQLRAELASFVEASLEPCDYTTDGECTGWEATDYDRAKANITEMHRVLDVREGRLFDAMDERKRLDAEVEQLRAELEHAKLALMRDNEGIRLWMTDCAKVSDRLRSELSGALAEVKRLTAENVLLRGELRVTEDERDNARLDVEADVRAELAAKVGA